LHLPQFVHAEIELHAPLSSTVALCNRVLHDVTRRLRDQCGASIQSLAGTLAHIEAFLALAQDVPAVPMADAARWAQAQESTLTTLGPDGVVMLTRAGERAVVDHFGRAEALWLTAFDDLAVPFYQALDSTGKAINADLLLGRRETIGAGQRHVTRAELLAALQRQHVSPTGYEWYLDLRDSAPMLTSGMGLGTERYLMWLLRQDDIRDVTVFYRENGLTVSP